MSFMKIQVVTFFLNLFISVPTTTATALEWLSLLIMYAGILNMDLTSDLQLQ